MELITYEFDGLLCTDIVITNQGKSIVINNVAIDTGAVESIISSKIVKQIGIRALTTDKTAVTRSAGGGKMRYFYKNIDEVTIGDLKFKDIKMDFGDIDPFKPCAETLYESYAGVTILFFEFE